MNQSIFRTVLVRLQAATLYAIVFLCAAMAVQVRAEESAAAGKPATATFRFDIPAKPLLSALTNFTEATGVQFLYPSADGLKADSQAVSGTYTAEEALRILLSGTGITFRFIKPNTVTLEKLDANGAHLTAPVRVQGATENGAAGINGSTDPTATEGTKSYTSSALSIASKTAQSIKDTPQTVSVITQQRMQDQNLTDFTSVMNQATGITMVMNTGNNLSPNFYSRGFAIASIQIDGGAPLATNATNAQYGYNPQIDMAMYDHVEILRGADGLFNGYGDPSGSVNLTRKRPLDHDQVVVELADGSWNNSREMIDAAGPLGFDGKLRGRFVVSNQDQDYFYDTASKKHTLAYGMLEADLTPSTLVSVGFSDTRQDAVPWIGGLPRYQTGADLNLPRSTCLCANWSHWNFDTNELFAQIEQNFGENWSTKFNLTRTNQESHSKSSNFSGAVDPVTDLGPTLGASMVDYSSAQTLADFTVNGAFDLFGHSQQLVFGGNYQDVNGGGYTAHPPLISGTYVSPTGAVGRPAVNVFDFDPSNPAYAEPASNSPALYYPELGQKQWGAYATLRLTPLDPLHFVTGLRYSYYEYVAHQQTLDTRTGNVATDYAPYSYTGHNLTWPPNFSVVYDLSKAISAYASYTDIYQSQAQYVDHSGKLLGPVTGSNIEAGLKFEGFADKLNMTMAAYRIEQKNFALFIDYGNYADTYGVLPDGVHSCCYSSDNQVNFSQGLDVEITGEVLPGWQLFAGYTFNLNKVKGSDATANGNTIGAPLISLAPKHLLKLWTSYQFQSGDVLRRLNIGGGVNAQTASYNSGSACTAFTYGTDANGNETSTCNTYVDYNYTQGFYAIFSARIGYQIDKHWNAALNFNNITDRRYYQTMGTSTSGNWYGDPRNFMLTLRGTY